MGISPTEARLQNRVDRREVVRQKHEALLAEREDAGLNETDKKTIDLYRTEAAELDAEIEGLIADEEANRKAEEVSRQLRRASLDAAGFESDGVIYRTMAEYARDVILTRNDKTAGAITKFVSPAEVQAAEARLELLKRTPANTLSSNVAGLQPPQYIDQIFQVINTSRPLVASAQQTTLNRGTLTYPQITQRPVVAVQGTEKTEAGNTGLIVAMETTTASTYLGGGDLSWQAVNWSTPDALDLWFRIAAADYALKTEQDAAQALQHSAFSYNISSTLSGSYTFANLMTAVGAGYSDVFTNSGRTANTIWMAPDVFGYVLGLTSNAFTQFTNVSGSNIGPLDIIVSRGMDAGVAVVGDRAGLLVAETAGAPVELRVVEPAIGGYEVGIIGAFEAVVTDPGSFAMITTAS